VEGTARPPRARDNEGGGERRKAARVRSVVVGTAGHIDHGKSALVRALTGIDPDRLKEEKARGITIDLGFAHATIDGVDVAFVDVPGHERFVKNMLAGVGGIDAVLLVIAADESVMPQTREHFAICRLLQIPAGIVALTKADLVDADTLELARLDVRELLAGSFLAGAEIVPVSSKTGAGLDELRAAIARVALRVPDRGREGPPRLPIDRVFSIRGFGTVVTGTLTSGSLRVEDDLVLLPGGRRVKVRGIQVHGAPQASVGAGHRTAVNLQGIDVEDVQRGATLTRNGAFPETRRFDARLDLLPDAPPLKHGARVRFHHGTSELLGRIALAAQPGQGVIGELTPGASAFVRVRLEAPAVLTRGDRFVIRAYSPAATIAGGCVLDPEPARTPIRTPVAGARFARLNQSARDAALVFLDERGASGMTHDVLARRLGLTNHAADALVHDVQAAGAATLVDGGLVASSVVAALEQRLLEGLEAHHATAALSEGLPREEARERFFARALPGLFETVIGRLEKAGRITGRDRLSLAGHGVSLNADEERARVALERAFRQGGLTPPDLTTAASGAGVPGPVADRVAKLLLRQKTLVKVDTLVFHADALQRLKDEVVKLKTQGSGARVDVASFKERYGVSRKYAIPLLEWLDRERVTRRVGDARIVL